MNLDALLAAWLPQQRWFGGKGRTITAVHAAMSSAITSERVTLIPTVVSVSYAGGGTERYQVPLALRTEPWQDLHHALIGVSDEQVFYDAPHDPDAAAVLLDALRTEHDTGVISFHRIGDIPADLHARIVGAEQSNTSLVYGDELICKIFRRLAPGRNPDLELTRALQEAGSPHVAPIRGWAQTTLDGEEATVAVLQTFARSASEGWQLALTSVRDLYAEADLHADEVGGDFAGESHRLGATTAEVHSLLAQALPTAIATDEDIQDTAARMQERVSDAAAAVPELQPYAPSLRAAFATVPGHHIGLQRIHGDFHLGQVLRTDAGWLLLDFEGEPARPLAERRRLASPLRDVAGMLRSFDYAARSLLADHPGAPGLIYRAEEWAARNRDAFCAGYAEVSGHDPREEIALLRAFELDKAVYEVLYEARNRPSWLPIPLGSIERLVTP